MTTSWPGLSPQVTSTTSAPADGPRLDPLRPVDARLLREENQVRVLVALDGGLGDREGLVRLADLDAGLAELVGPELPSGFGSSARTLVVRVFWSTSVPTQVIRPVKVALLARRGRARDGEA